MDMYKVNRGTVLGCMKYLKSNKKKRQAIKENNEAYLFDIEYNKLNEEYEEVKYALSYLMSNNKDIFVYDKKMKQTLKKYRRKIA